MKAGAGMGVVLQMTNEKLAYTLSDRATWLSSSLDTDLQIVCENDESGILYNQYGVSGKDFTIHSKGLELVAYEPRKSVGLGLGYAESNRGGCHLNGGYLVILEGLGLSINPTTYHGKADLTMLFQDLMKMISSSGQCLFPVMPFFHLL